MKWSENSEICKILWELPSRWAKFCEILSHIVRYGMYDKDIKWLPNGYFPVVSLWKYPFIACFTSKMVYRSQT